MEKNIPPMNGNDFLRFMSKGNSLTCVMEEYYSIVPKQKENLLKTSIEEEGTSKNTSNMQLSRHLHRRLKLKNNETTLNASFIDGHETERKYIYIKILQKNICDEFWQIVWDYKVRIIVMMSDNNSDQSLFPDVGCVTVCDKFQIKTLDISVKPHYKMTLLSLTDQSGQEHKISHCQYTAWPRDNFSHQLDAFIDFHCNVKDMCLQLERQPAEKAAPIIVQCLGGLNISAVFCVFDICVAQFEKTGTISVASVLKKVQQQKYGFMSRLENYTLCYQLLGVYIEKKLSDIVS